MATDKQRLARAEVMIRQLQGGTLLVPTLAANWSDYAPTFQGAAYSKHGRVVMLHGMVKKSIAVVSGETIFTLPEGFRPGNTLLFTTTSNAALARVDVTAAGAVIVQVGNAGWLSLDGLSFVADE